MFSEMEPRGIAAMVALAVGFLLLLVIFLRARVSRYPAVLYVCAGYMVVLHAVWVVGLLTSQLFETGFGTLELLTFPWSIAVITNMSMVGFGVLPELLLNYLRFVLGGWRAAVPAAVSVCVGAETQAATAAKPPVGLPSGNGAPAIGGRGRC